MKDIKITLKAVVEHWRTWQGKCWKTYVALAALVSVVAYSFMRVCGETLLPLWVFRLETEDWNLILALVEINLFWTVVLVVSVLVLPFASIKAHRAMKCLVSSYEKKELGKSRRNVLTAYAVVTMIATILVAVLPSVVVFISYIASCRSGMLLDEVATPMWAHTAIIICTFFGILFCEIAATIVRLFYKEIPLATKNVENEVK